MGVQDIRNERAEVINRLTWIDSLCDSLGSIFMFPFNAMVYDHQADPIMKTIILTPSPFLKKTVEGEQALRDYVHLWAEANDCVARRVQFHPKHIELLVHLKFLSPMKKYNNRPKNTLTSLT